MQLVVWDSGEDSRLNKRISVTFETTFDKEEDAIAEGKRAGLGTVLAFIRLNLDDPAIRGLAAIASLDDIVHGQASDTPFLTLLRNVFIAGKKSRVLK